MKKQILLIALIIGLTTLSCSKNDDDQGSEFQGIWTGTYTGTQDNGTWTANIDSNGKVTGTASSTVHSITLQLNGKISSNGTLTATIGSASNGTEFNGKMTGTSGSGAWENTNQGINGSWSGSKQ